MLIPENRKVGIIRNILFPVRYNAHMIQRLISSLEKSDKLTSDTNLYTFTLEPDQIAIKPGQYITLSIVSSDGKLKYNRAYSVAGFGGDARVEGDIIKTKTIKLLIRTVANGKATQILEKLAPGSKIPLFGPSGNLTPQIDTGVPLLLCGSATGIAPFLSFLEYFDLSKTYPETYVFFGLRHITDLHLLEKLEGFQKIWEANNAKLDIRVCVSQETQGLLSSNKYSKYLFSGRMTCHIPSGVPSNFSGCTYICGGKDFVLGMQEFVTKNLPQSKMFVEKFF